MILDDFFVCNHDRFIGFPNFSAKTKQKTLQSKMGPLREREQL